MKIITEAWVAEFKPCEEAVEWWRKRGSKNDCFAVLQDLMTDNKNQWASWVVSRLLSKQDGTKYAVFAAEQVIHLWNEKYPDDDRPQRAIAAAKNYLDDPIVGTVAEADAAAAYAAAYDADTDATAYAAYAAYAAAAAAVYADATVATAAAYVAVAAATIFAFNTNIQMQIISYGIELLKTEKEL